MKLRIKQNIIQISSLLIIVFVVYSCEPHLFNMDDGPYYSEDYGGDIEL